jgi:hypothetical protein
MEPPDNEYSHSLKNMMMELSINLTTQTTISTNKMATQTKYDTQLIPQSPILHLELLSATTTAPSLTSAIHEPRAQTMPSTSKMASQPTESPSVLKLSAEGVEPPVPMQNAVPAAHTDSATQMDTITTTTILTINVNTQITPTCLIVVDVGTQTMHHPRQRVAAMQKEPLDEEQPCTSKDIKVLMVLDPTIIADPKIVSQASHSALLHDELVKTLEQNITPAPLLVPEPS